MGSVVTIFAAAAVGFLLLYLAFQLDDEHYLLKFLLLFLFVGTTIIVGKGAMDESDYCSWNVVNSTVSGSTTNYEYDYQCETNTNQTPNVFYNGILWFVRLFALYAFGYFTYRALVYLGWVVPKGGGEE